MEVEWSWAMEVDAVGGWGWRRWCVDDRGGGDVGGDEMWRRWRWRRWRWIRTSWRPWRWAVDVDAVE